MHNSGLLSLPQYHFRNYTEDLETIQVSMAKSGTAAELVRGEGRNDKAEKEVRKIISGVEILLVVYKKKSRNFG